MNVNALNVAEPSIRFLPAADVRTGYKLTEIGIIPADWHILSLGEISSFRTGPFGSALHKSDYIEGGIPLVNPMHIVDGEIRPAASTTVTAQAAQRLAAYRFRRKDIVIGRRGDMGRCAVIGEVEDGWLCGTGSLIIRCNGNVDASFIQRTLTTERVIRAIEDASVGSTMINLNQGALARLRIQCPPIIEQRAIAEALSDVDELLRALEAIIAKKRALKQATMRQLLTGRTRLPGFRADWKTKSLGDVADIKSGATPSTEVNGYWKGNIPWCTPTDITATSGKYLLITERQITSEGLASCGANLLPRGTLLLCSRATIGEVKIAVTEVCTNQGFKSLVCRDSVSNEFLYYLLLMLKPEMIKRAIGSTFMEIGKRDVESIAAKFPEKGEQTAIATVLSHMDAEIAALEARRDKTRAIKQGMMQQLLTGRIRLVKPQPPEAEA